MRKIFVCFSESLNFNLLDKFGFHLDIFSINKTITGFDCIKSQNNIIFDKFGVLIFFKIFISVCFFQKMDRKPASQYLNRVNSLGLNVSLESSLFELIF